MNTKVFSFDSLVQQAVSPLYVEPYDLHKEGAVLQPLQVMADSGILTGEQELLARGMVTDRGFIQAHRRSHVVRLARDVLGSGENTANYMARDVLWSLYEQQPDEGFDFRLLRAARDDIEWPPSTLQGVFATHIFCLLGDPEEVASYLLPRVSEGNERDAAALCRRSLERVDPSDGLRLLRSLMPRIRQIHQVPLHALLLNQHMQCIYRQIETMPRPPDWDVLPEGGEVSLLLEEMESIFSELSHLPDVEREQVESLLCEVHVYLRCGRYQSAAESLRILKIVSVRARLYEGIREQFEYLQDMLLDAEDEE